MAEVDWLTAEKEVKVDCCPQHACPVCGGCLFFPCKVTANGIHPKERDRG